MRLSPHFLLAELEHTDHAISNAAPGTVLPTLAYGARHVLEPILAAIGVPLTVTSGYRSPVLNQAVGGAPNSQHLRGEAADLVAQGRDQIELWAVVRDLTLRGENPAPIDQAIVYEHKSIVHVSWTQRREPRGDLRVGLPDGRTVPWATYDGPLKPPRRIVEAIVPEISTPPLTPSPDSSGAPMQTLIRVPRQAADQFLDTTKDAAAQSVQRLLREFADGKLTIEEATDTATDMVESVIDGIATMADVVVDLPSPAEELSDLSITQAAETLKAVAAEPIGRAIQAVDDAVGYNPRRAARRVLEALEEDAQDGIVGDDKRRRVYRLSERIHRRSPELAKQLELDFSGQQLLVGGEPWGAPPKRFRLRG